MEIIISPRQLTNTQQYIKPDINTTIVFDKLPKNIILPIPSNLITKEFYASTRELLVSHPNYTIQYVDPVQQKLFVRKHFYNSNNNMNFVWDAFCKDDTPEIRKQIYSYAILYLQGGIIVSPNITTNISLYNLHVSSSFNNDLCTIFPQNGYVNPDFIASTKQHPIIKGFLIKSCHNILYNQKSLPLKKEVHTRFDETVGKYMMRHILSTMINKPDFYVPDNGLSGTILLVPSISIYNKIFRLNKYFYTNIKMLKQVHMDYNINDNDNDNDNDNNDINDNNNDNNNNNNNNN
jgi:hypothetical protein